MNRDLYPEIHAALLIVRSKPLPTGLCVNIVRNVDNKLFDQVITGAVHYIILKIMKDWGEHSGDESYPVKSPYPARYSAREAFYMCPTNGYWVGEYGAARRRLLDYMIEKTKPLD